MFFFLLGSLFSLDCIACFLLVVLCLFAYVSANVHILNESQSLFSTHSKVLQSLESLKMGTTDLEVPGRHSLCTDILSSFCVDG